MNFTSYFDDFIFRYKFIKVLFDKFLIFYNRMWIFHDYCLIQIIIIQLAISRRFPTLPESPFTNEWSNFSKYWNIHSLFSKIRVSKVLLDFKSRNVVHWDICHHYRQPPPQPKITSRYSHLIPYQKKVLWRQIIRLHF